jgi:hypothetical protein
VIRLADPVELPDGNKTELCHALHVTLAPFLLPLDRCPSLYSISLPVEVYFHSSPTTLPWQGIGVTTASHCLGRCRWKVPRQRFERRGEVSVEHNGQHDWGHDIGRGVGDLIAIPFRGQPPHLLLADDYRAL